MSREESSNLRRRAVSNPKPDHLGRRAVEKAQPVKVSVLRDQDAAMLTCQFPYVRIGCTTAIKQPHMECARKDIDQLSNQDLRQLFVEEQSHGSGRNANRPALALGRVGQARADVIVGELGEIGQQFGL